MQLKPTIGQSAYAVESSPSPWYRNFWQPRVALPNITASLLAWLISIILSTSFAALIFQGRLSAYYTVGIGMVFVSSMVLSLLMAFFGSDRATMAYTQSTAVIILAAISSHIIESAPPTMSDDALFYLVVITIALASLFSGLFFLLMGVLKMGNLIRYIPYPVIGGFLAGSGWLLVQGALDMLVGMRLGLDTISELFQPDTLAHWLPGVFLGLLLLIVLRRTENVLLLPVVMIGALLAFFAYFSLAGQSLDDLIRAGWFLDGFDEAVRWQLPAFHALSQVDASLVFQQSGSIIAVTILCTLNLLLNASGLELVINRELNFNRELTVTGAGNVLSGLLGGGIVGFPSVTLTTLVHRMGAYGRFVGVMLAVLLGITLVSGAEFIALFPRVILGGLLMYLGFNFLTDWLYDGWFKLPFKDYVVMLVILFVIGTIGILEGVVVGFLATTILFVLEYSRISVVKQELSGSVFRSNIDRSYEENTLLRELGKHIWVMRLQGFIFFGTSHQFVQRIKMRVLDEEQEAYLYVIIDFESVRGIDTSAVVDFLKLRHLAEAHGFKLILTGMSESLKKVLYESRFFDANASNDADRFDDLDHAMEWCENDLLKHADLSKDGSVTLQEQFNKRTTISLPVVMVLTDYLERLELGKGAYLVHQGDEPDDMYFIESGRVDIQLEIEAGRSIRLRSMSAGTIVGEVGFYLGRPRSASIVVTEPGVFYRLTRDALRRMEKENTNASSAFHVFVVCVLGERLSLTNNMIQSLME